MGPLEDLVRTLEPPIVFLTQEEANLERTVLPLGILSEKIDRVLSASTNGAIQDAMGELRMLLRQFAVGLPTRQERQERRRALGRIAALLRSLKQERRERPAGPYLPTRPFLGQMLASLKTSVQYVKGVGPKRAEQLRRLGLNTVEDLIYHLPFRYEDRRRMLQAAELREGEEATLLGTITRIGENRKGRGGGKVLEALLEDDSGSVRLVWYHQLGYFRTRYQPGDRVLVHGKVEARRRLSSAAGWPRKSRTAAARRIIHPEVEVITDTDALEVGGVVPIYNKPTQMSVVMMRRIVRGALDNFLPQVPSALPADLASKRGVMSLGEALRLLHTPPGDADVDILNRAASLAHRSVVYDELFYLQLGMAIRRRALGMEPGIAFRLPSPRVGELMESIPFELTTAQRRVLQEIEIDMSRCRPMNRLVQGDVGSGKTVVALLAALVAIDTGYQAALMAPTELLAEQHCQTLRSLGSRVGIRIALLTGDIQGKVRSRLESALARGDIDLLVGTHTLIQQGVRFKRLGLAIIDEQHRFGVRQRAALKRQGENPDTLLLTATPIPRTLALTIYGDLDVSSLDELPPGRKPVVTRVYHERQGQRVYEWVKHELDAGRQAYVVCPLVEESDKSDLKSATKHAEQLSENVFRGYRVGLVHGRMRGEEKEGIMRRFKKGELQCLVSTTVIEVGIDVPNATVMVIEHAERFGLAQLHQLRGRVGRGDVRSICFLLAGYVQGEEARKRLAVMEETNDGFRIAEEDLALRGPGEFLGTKQSGLPDFRVANIVRDAAILVAAREDAMSWLAAAGDLSSPTSRGVRQVLENRWAGRLELARVG